MPRRQPRHQVLAVLQLLRVVRGAVDGHYEPPARPALRHNRVVILLEPDVLAYVDAHRHAADVVCGAVRAGDEVARFVEHAVVGETLLVVDAGESAVAGDGGGVTQPLVIVHEAEHGGYVRRGGGYLPRPFEVVPDELRAEHQVLRRVARYRKLREGDEVRAEGARPSDVLDYLLRVAFQIADGRVDLGHRKSERAHCPSGRVNH